MLSYTLMTYPFKELLLQAPTKYIKLGT